jgi:hypothetical protein
VRFLNYRGGAFCFRFGCFGCGGGESCCSYCNDACEHGKHCDHVNAFSLTFVTKLITLCFGVAHRVYIGIAEKWWGRIQHPPLSTILVRERLVNALFLPEREVSVWVWRCERSDGSHEHELPRVQRWIRVSIGERVNSVSASAWMSMPLSTDAHPERTTRGTS